MTLHVVIINFRQDRFEGTSAQIGLKYRSALRANLAFNKILNAAQSYASRDNNREKFITIKDDFAASGFDVSTIASLQIDSTDNEEAVSEWNAYIGRMQTLAAVKQSPG